MENERYDCLVTDLVFDFSWNSGPRGEPPGVVLAEFARKKQPGIITIAITGANLMEPDYASAFDTFFVKVLSGDPDEKAFDYLNRRFAEEI